MASPSIGAKGGESLTFFNSLSATRKTTKGMGEPRSHFIVGQGLVHLQIDKWNFLICRESMTHNLKTKGI